MNKAKFSALLMATLCAVSWMPQSFAAESGTPDAAPPVLNTAPTPSKPAADNDWHFLAAIPLWLPAISGDIGTSRFGDIPVSSSISDLFSHLNFGSMAHMEARKSQIGFGIDMIYVNVDDAIDVSRATPALLTLNLGMKQVLAEGFMFYRLVQDGDSHNPSTFDLLGGTRYYWTESELDTSSEIGAWFDLMLGIRGQIAFGEHFSVRGRSDYAFLGSKFTYNLIGEAAWTFSEHWAVTAGYRAMNITYENTEKRRTWDINYHGPVIGGSFSW